MKKHNSTFSAKELSAKLEIYQGRRLAYWYTQQFFTECQSSARNVRTTG